MNIAITGKNIELSEALRAYVEEKVSALGKQCDEITQIDVELDRNMHHKTGEVFHVRMNISVPHELLHGEDTGATVYSAIDTCRDHMSEQLRGYEVKKDDRKRRARKTRRDWKSILAFWK